MGKKNLMWVIIFSVVIIVCSVSLAILTKSNGAMSADIYCGDTLLMHIDDISGEELQEYKAETEYGVNIIRWQNNEIWVEEADCKNQDCVEYGRLHSEGLSIICAPHKLVITLHRREALQ